MIKINGKEIAFPAGDTVEKLLLENGYESQRIAVERNGEILPKAAFSSTPVADGDVYEVVRFVGGG